MKTNFKLLDRWEMKMFHNLVKARLQFIVSSKIKLTFCLEFSLIFHDFITRAFCGVQFYVGQETKVLRCFDHLIKKIVRAFCHNFCGIQFDYVSQFDHLSKKIVTAKR